MSSAHIFVLVLVALVLVGGLLKEHLRQRRREEPARDEEWEATVARLQELEERVRVLERIVTDPGDSIRREINRL